MRSPYRVRTCSVCHSVDHDLRGCPEHAKVARIRLTQALEEMADDSWASPRADWVAIRERLDLARDVTDIDVDLAAATIRDVLERWPRDGVCLAPAWRSMVDRAGLALSFAIAVADAAWAAA